MKNIFAVGTGPGASQYLTLQAVDVIKNADIIFAPNNSGKHNALDTVRDFIVTDKIMYLDFKMGSVIEDDYKIAANQILQNTKDNETAVFLTIGDPMLYSTFIYLLPYLKIENVNLKVVSGIPSYIAAAGVGLFPLASRMEILAITDHLTENVLTAADSLALLKTSKNKINDIAELEKNGFDYVYVKRASFQNQSILTSKEKDLILDDVDYMSLLLAHKKDKGNK